MSNTKRVLIVDDDPEIVLGTTLRLRSAGYEPLTAFGGRQGMAAAIAEHPDATILDVQMPEMDGLEMIREMKDHDETRDIPVVILSASLRDRRRALDAGARFFLTKPCRGAELLEAVSAAIEEPSMIWNASACASVSARQVPPAAG